MNEEEAQRLRAVREAEQSQHLGVVHRRAGDDWVVVGLPAQKRVTETGAKKGEPLEVRDDPRPADERNVPPYGG